MTTILRVADADELDLVADLDQAALDAPGGDGAAALDAEHVLDRHQERLVDRLLGGRDVRVDRVHQLLDGLVRRIGRVVGCLERLQRGAADDRDVVTRELVLGQQLADLELDEVEQLRVVDHVDLVEEDHDVRHLDLAGQQDVLAGLGHRAVGRGDHQDGAVHLGGAGDHVLDVVGVARAVDVGVVARVGLVLDVGDGDEDARSRSSGALSIDSKARYSASPFRARYLVMAAVSDVLPWSMWPIVLMLTCGLVRSNFFWPQDQSTP